MKLRSFPGILATNFAIVFASPAFAELTVIEGPQSFKASTAAANPHPDCNADPFFGRDQSYNVTIETTNRNKAGTDGLLVIEMRSECRFFNVNVLATGGPLERGTSMTEGFSTLYAGRLVEIKLSIDPRGDRPGWHGQRLILKERYPSTRSFCVKVDRWLAEHEPNGYETPWMTAVQGDTC
jgi:hypothetical protein